MTERALPELQPLYTEPEAAHKLGIAFKWLRAERYAGRIGWKKVAGRVMYRHQDLIDWQQRGIAPCPEADPPARPVSSRKKSKAATRSGLSSGTMESGAEKVQRVLANAERRIRSSRAGFTTITTTNAGSPSAHVIPMKSQ